MVLVNGCLICLEYGGFKFELVRTYSTSRNKSASSSSAMFKLSNLNGAGDATVGSMMLVELYDGAAAADDDDAADVEAGGSGPAADDDDAAALLSGMLLSGMLLMLNLLCKLRECRSLLRGSGMLSGSSSPSSRFLLLNVFGIVFLLVDSIDFSSLLARASFLEIPSTCLLISLSSYVCLRNALSTNSADLRKVCDLPLIRIELVFAIWLIVAI